MTPHTGERWEFEAGDSEPVESWDVQVLGLGHEHATEIDASATDGGPDPTEVETWLEGLAWTAEDIETALVGYDDMCLRVRAQCERWESTGEYLIQTGVEDTGDEYRLTGEPIRFAERGNTVAEPR